MTPEIQERTYKSAIAVGIILFLVATAVTMAQYKIPTIMTDIIAMFNTDAGTASWLMSIFTFVGIIVAVPTGFLAKRLGPKKVVLIAMVLSVCAGLVGAFASSLGLLLVTRAIEGVALVFVITCAPLIIQACVNPARHGTSMGIYMLGGMLGATFGGILTPTLFYSVGYMGLWLSYAAISAVTAIIFAFYVKIPAAPPVAPMPEGSEGEPADAGKGSGYRVFFKGNTLLFFFAFAMFQLVLLTILAYAPTSLQQRGMSPTISGFVTTLPMLLAIISSIAFGAISDRMGRCKPLCILGMLILGPCCFVMLNFSGVPMWIALVVMGLTSMGTPTVFVAAYPTVLGKPELMSIGMGVLLLVQSLGQFLGTAVPAMLVGPNIDQWMLCGGVAMILALLGTVAVAVSKFR